MFNVTLIVYVKTLSKFAFKYFFNFTAFAEVNKVVVKETEKQWRFSFDDDASEDAWGIWACFEAERFECSLASVVPVSWASPEAVEGLFLEKVSARGCYGTAVGWPDDVLLVVWEYGLAEGLADISCFCNFSHLSCDSDEEA